MSSYEPGTVAVATVRGVPDVRVMRTEYAYGPWSSAVNACETNEHDDDDVTDVRPLVVLDHSHIGDALAALQNILSSDRVMLMDHVHALHELAQQIEAQTKPPRIPEPGLWGIVEGYPGARTGRPVEFVRDSMHETAPWRSLADGSAWEWDYVIDPVLVRDGIEDGAK